jgi:hypothetical protein
MSDVLHLREREDFHYNGMSRQDWFRQALIDLYLYQLEQKYGPLEPEPEPGPAEATTAGPAEFTKKGSYSSRSVLGLELGPEENDDTEM